MTLQQLRETKYEDIFLAVMAREINWENAENIRTTLEGFPEVKTVADILRISVEYALKEENIPLTDENKRKLENDVKKEIASRLEETNVVAVLKQGDAYIDLSEVEKVGEEFRIKMLIPFSKYFKKDEYSFKVDENGKPYLDVEEGPLEQLKKCFMD